jgi:5-methylcytosine-specific restriction endonuclease McrA
MSVLTQRKVLVGNKGWSPIAIVTVERAICLVCSTYNDGEPKAKIVDPTGEFRLYTWEDWSKLIPNEGEACIRSAKASFRIPEIVILTRYNKLPNQRVHFSRRTIYKRDGNQCQYCGAKPGTPELSIDHVLPRSRGGMTTWENCVLACTRCNKRKADRIPEECNMKLLKKPTKPKYSFFKGEYQCKSWETLLGAAYWLTELENDNDEL